MGISACRTALVSEDGGSGICQESGSRSHDADTGCVYLVCSPQERRYQHRKLWVGCLRTSFLTFPVFSARESAIGLS